MREVRGEGGASPPGGPSAPIVTGSQVAGSGLGGEPAKAVSHSTDALPPLPDTYGSSGRRSELWITSSG